MINNLKNQLLKAILWFGIRNRRVMFIDWLCLVFAVYIGFALRLSLFMDKAYIPELTTTAAFFPPIIIAVLAIGKNYSIVWPRASVEEYASLAAWYFTGALLFMIANTGFHLVNIPRTSFAVMILTGLFFMTIFRAVLRLVLATGHPNLPGAERVLIVGAGNAGTMLARDIKRNSATTVTAGFVDDAHELQNMIIAGAPVLGRREDLPRLIRTNHIDTILIAMPSANGEQIKAYMETITASRTGVNVRVLPSLLNLADGLVTVNNLRRVKLEDLLRRKPVMLDNDNIAAVIKGKSVLVTGAGGSIGSEICRQVLDRGPAQLLLLGHGEQSIYSLLEEISDMETKTQIIPIIADVADTVMIERIFGQYAPQLVFHAAAHKHVPLMEWNPREALRVNSFGTWNIASAAGRHNAERFLMISTDKAVHPTSIMGATKRTAERLLFSVQRRHPETKYMAVRFGNVLGSRGSVVPKFERQIAAGGPVTVTHPEMKRYFMLIPEAVSLVLQAQTMSSGGELYILDMGEPVKISEMAETLIRLHGYEPGRDIEIRYTGIRPGEKLYEELFYDPQHVEKTKHEKIFKTKFTADNEDVLSIVQQALEAYREGSLTEVEMRDLIFRLGSEGTKENGGAKKNAERKAC